MEQRGLLVEPEVSYRDLPLFASGLNEIYFDIIFDLLSNFTAVIKYPNTQNSENDS